MTELTLSIPDQKVDLIKQLISEIDGITLSSEYNYDDIFTPELIAMLEERKKTPREEFIPIEEVRAKIKSKYGV
jgi:hypothetical protein